MYKALLCISSIHMLSFSVCVGVPLFVDCEQMKFHACFLIKNRINEKSLHGVQMKCNENEDGKD